MNSLKLNLKIFMFTRDSPIPKLRHSFLPSNEDLRCLNFCCAPRPEPLPNSMDTVAVKRALDPNFHSKSLQLHTKKWNMRNDLQWNGFMPKKFSKPPLPDELLLLIMLDQKPRTKAQLEMLWWRSSSLMESMLNDD